jgi:hypothetical protein
MVNLDRILVSTKWETKFPLCFTWARIRVGSDHCPIFFIQGRIQKRSTNGSSLRDNGFLRRTSWPILVRSGSKQRKERVGLDTL